jgi:hypothetical protein
MSSFIGSSELSYPAIFFIVLALSGILLFQHIDQSVTEVSNVTEKKLISEPIPVIIFKLPRTGYLPNLLIFSKYISIFLSVIGSKLFD